MSTVSLSQLPRLYPNEETKPSYPGTWDTQAAHKPIALATQLSLPSYDRGEFSAHALHAAARRQGKHVSLLLTAPACVRRVRPSLSIHSHADKALVLRVLVRLGLLCYLATAPDPIASFKLFDCPCLPKSVYDRYGIPGALSQVSLLALSLLRSLCSLVPCAHA